MRLPRKGILIRIVIYGSLIGYFGWGAVKRYTAKRGADRAQTELREELEQHKSTVTLPDGSQQEIYEITPEQAERLFGVKAKGAAPTADPGTESAADSDGAAEPAPKAATGADADADPGPGD